MDREYAACSCMGKTARVSLPYRDDGETARWTETRFDGIGRVTLVIPPDGTASANRTGYKYGVTELNSTLYRVEAAFDAAGVGRARVLDAAGELKQVREDADQTTLESATTTDYDRRPEAAYTFAYHQRFDSATGTYGNYPVRLTNWTWTEILQGAQTRDFRADSLGRRVSGSHPEMGPRATSGTTPERFLSKTDARGTATTLAYDALNRPLTITYSDGTPPAMYDYDQGPYGIGRLHSASNADAAEVFTYDNMVRVTARSKTIGGFLFTSSATYNQSGLAETTTLPNGTTIDWAYDRMGRLAGVSSDWLDSTHPATLASNFVYDAPGAMLSTDWGNGTTTLRTFNGNQQLKTLQHGPSANPSQFLNLEYDYNEGVANTGKIVSITDHNDTTKTVGYTYDGFSRLKTAATSGAHWGLSWTYDRYGNRLSQTATKGTPPTNTLSIDAATNRVNGWTYDAAGNTLNDGSHTYAFDANNMIKTVDGGAMLYKYDAGGRRVMKVTASETTYYAFGAEYSSVSGWRRVFVAAGGVKVEYRDNQTWFHQADHLGTPRVQTDSSGNLVETWSYYPFGEQWEQTGSGGNEHRYTGHRRDPETGNDYAGARYLKGSKGRWLAVDPALGSTSNPRRLNRYAYVTGDAVNLVDPDGAEGTRPCLIRNPGDCGPRPEGEDPAPRPSKTPIIFPGIVGGEGQDVAKENTERSPQGGPSIGLPGLAAFAGEDAKRVQQGLTKAMELLGREECDTALKDFHIPSLKDLVSKYRINDNLFDGRFSARPIRVEQSNGEIVTMPLSQYLTMNRSTIGALVLNGGPNGGDGRTTFLSFAFLDAGGGVNQYYRRAVFLLHEAVHQFGGKDDPEFGGSGNLTEIIADKCTPALKNQLGNLIQ